MCHHSNSLYNCTLYIIKSHFKETGKYIDFKSLYDDIKVNEHYTSLPIKISQQILRLVDKDFRSFFALLNRKKKGEYSASIKEPSYKKKGVQFILILPNDQVTLKNNILKITIKLKIPFTKKINGVIKQLIIIPKYKGYYDMCLQYEEIKNNPENYDLNENNYLSIDLGINNLCACFSNVGPSFIMNGKPLKSYNQFYNKRKAVIQSELKIVNNKHWSILLSKITTNRNNYINNYFNQSVKKIIDYCLEYKIKNVVVGYNEGWKQNVDIGKRNNQSFMNIPHLNLRKKLEYKCNNFDMNFIQHEESYTSKCSFIDHESIGKHDEYLGKRVKRGLFKSFNGILLNADINGSGNILRKVVSNVLVTDEIVASMVKPVILDSF